MCTSCSVDEKNTRAAYARVCMYVFRHARVIMREICTVALFTTNDDSDDKKRGSEVFRFFFFISFNYSPSSSSLLCLCAFRKVLFELPRLTLLLRLPAAVVSAVAPLNFSFDINSCKIHTETVHIFFDPLLFFSPSCDIKTNQMHTIDINFCCFVNKRSLVRILSTSINRFVC